MIAQGTADLYKVEGNIEKTVDLSKITFAMDGVNYTDLPSVYAYGQLLALAFDFPPLKAWKVYKATANQKTSFNASEWVIDESSPFSAALGAAQVDGGIFQALSDGKVNITYSPNPQPSNPNPYDIWETTPDLVSIGSLSAADAEAFANSGTDKVYFYYGLDKQWHLCSAFATGSIKDSLSKYNIKSKATMFNTVDLPSGQKLVNGWISLISNENGGIQNSFGIIADQFYVGDSTNAYKPFIIDAANNEVIIDGVMKSSDFTTIGGAGFRLKAKAAGTETDPSIYGAYIKGSKIVAGIEKNGVIIDQATTNLRVTEKQSYTVFIFTRSATVPSTPPTGIYSGIPNGWYDLPPVGTDTLYVCWGYVSTTNTISAWSRLPLPDFTEIGVEGTIYQKSTSPYVCPASPPSSMPTHPNYGWSANIPTINQGEYLYILRVTSLGYYSSYPFNSRPVNGEYDYWSWYNAVTVGELSNGKFGIEGRSNSIDTVFRMDSDGLYINPTSTSKKALGLSSLKTILIDGVVSMAYQPASGLPTPTTGTVTHYVPIPMLDMYTGNGNMSRVLQAEVVGTYVKADDTTGSTVYTSHTVSKNLIHTMQLAMASTVYPYDSGGSIVITSDTTDATNLPATKIDIIFDATGTTAGAQGFFLKLISRTGMSNRWITPLHITDYTEYRFIVYEVGRATTPLDYSISLFE